MANVTGWNELYSGNLIQAAVQLYNIEVGGWAIGVLFIVYQFMLYLKTRSLPLAIVTTMFFLMMGLSAVFLKEWSKVIIIVTLVMEIAGILYLWVFE